MDTFNDFPLDPALIRESGNSGDHDPDADADAEAEAIEAIRVAINYNNNNISHQNDNIVSASTSRDPHSGLEANGQTGNDKLVELEGIVQQLHLLSGQDGVMLGGNGSGVLGGLLRGLEGLLEGLRKQGEIGEYLGGSGDIATLVNLDVGLSQLYVPRAEYDDLKQKYDVLLASTSGYNPSGPSRNGSLPQIPGSDSIPSPSASTSTLAVPNVGSKKRKARQSKSSLPTPTENEELKDMTQDDQAIRGIGQIGRKRRSIKLEHLVHQMANRRLGLEYPITNFRCSGSTVLPDPATPAPPINMSANGVQEYRPDFTKSVEEGHVAEFIGVVVGDAWAGWVGGVGEGEMESVDIVKVQEAVETYWIRLQKRWLEQQARTRGEMHKDELTRKKQNQYRRQQSLVGRRIAAFDASPLNACRLRALYRTLLTLDFAAPTNERPDPSRTYTEDQWNAYRKQQLGSRAALGHEIVDIFWLSPAVRSLLILLDTYSTARSSTQRKKGRPKAPSPVFHLPKNLWDTSSSKLPILREKDNEGLPIPNSPGIVLFHFHVDPDIIAKYPDWASGLYDDPPPDTNDAALSSLAEILSGEGYELLLSKTKKEKDRLAGIRELSEEEVREILARPDDILEEQAEEELIIDIPSLIPPTTTETLVSVENDEGMEEIGNINLSTIDVDDNEEIHIQSFVSLESSSSKKEKRNTGTSLNARKLGKKLGQIPPEGAALPVPKRQRISGVGVGSAGIGVAAGAGAGGHSLGLGQNLVGFGNGHGQVGLDREVLHRDVGFLAGL